MSVTYSLDGVPLDDPQGRWRLIRGTTVGMGSVTRAVDQQIPGVDGSIAAAHESQDVPSFVARIEAKGSTFEEMRSNWSALLALLSPSGDVPLVQSVDGLDWSITARGRSVAAPDFSAPRKTMTTTATLRLPGVYWRAGSADWAKSAPTSGTTYEVTSLAGSTAPVDDALVLVTGPVSSPKVTCGSSWVQLDVTLASGEKALIDCAAWSVRRGTGVTFAGGGSAASGRLITSGSPYLLRLQPRMRATDPTDTAVKVSLSGTGFTSATKLEVRARPAYMV